MLQSFDFTGEFVPADAEHDSATSDAVQVQNSDLKLLCELGILGLAEDHPETSRPIFALLDRKQPWNAAGPIGLAMVDFARGEEAAAFARLRLAIRTRKSCLKEAKAVLCVLLSASGRGNEARPLRREIMKGPNCGARRLVSTTLCS